MSKGKLYKINKFDDEKKNDLISFGVSIFLNAIVLIVASNVFDGLYVKNFLCALVAAFVISFLNYALKPFLVICTLPITISTLGLLYPLSNMIILWLCSIIMGSSFETGGFLSLFFVSIFIGLCKVFIDRCINTYFGGK